MGTLFLIQPAFSSELQGTSLKPSTLDKTEKFKGEVSFSTAPLKRVTEDAIKLCRSTLLEQRSPSLEMGVHVQGPGD